MTVNVWYLKNGEWICADMSDSPFTYDDMLVMWQEFGPNVMCYW
jgi:hypothetical protein